MRYKILNVFNGAKLTPDQRKNRTRMLLISFMIILAILVAGRFLVNAYGDYADNLQNDIEINTLKYNSLVRLVSEAEKYKNEHLALNRFRNDFLNAKLIQGATPALAEAQLQNIINTMAEESNLNLLTMNMLPRTQANGVTHLKIGITGRGEIEAIQNFLYKASVHEKFIFVDQMEVRILNHRERRFFNFNAQLVAWTKL